MPSILHILLRSFRPAFVPLLLITLLPLPACSGDDPPTPVSPQDSTKQTDSSILYMDPSVLCTIEDTRLDEISGIAPSRRSDGIYWMHNDSGGEPTLTAIDSSGRTLAVCTLDGAMNRDWEDMASVTLNGISWLYVGDIGDNDKRHDALTVYRLREPEVLPSWRDRAISSAVESARFRYPDGPRDCEALMVDARDGAVILLEKSGTSCGVYSAIWPGDGGEAMLQRVASFRLPFDFSFWRLVTAADLHPDGRRVLVRTYNALLEYETTAGSPFPSIFDSTAARIIATPGLQQAEAACYSRSGRDILTTSEGVRPPLLILRRKH